jgi:hypothetical protein
MTMKKMTMMMIQHPPLPTTTTTTLLMLPPMSLRWVYPQATKLDLHDDDNQDAVDVVVVVDALVCD